ncbi:MAG: hypothetical protein AAYR33_07735 [Acetobacteraceae bacterium]
MARNLTSADGVFTLTVETLFNAPITLENWGTDRAWEADALDQVETQMSIDGYLNAGFIPCPVDMTLYLNAASSSVVDFEVIMTAQTTSRTIYRLDGELTLLGISRKYTFNKGVLLSGAPLPDGMRILANRAFRLRWERVFPVGF